MTGFLARLLLILFAWPSFAVMRHSFRHSRLTVTRENLPQAVEAALAECQLQLDAAKMSCNSKLERDLNSALYALRLIDSELKQVSSRPKEQRSAAFTRYVVDEEPNMVMNEELKELIVKIEDLYRRYDVK